MLKAPEASALSDATQIPLGNPALQRPKIGFASDASSLLSDYSNEQRFFFSAMWLTISTKQ